MEKTIEITLREASDYRNKFNEHRLSKGLSDYILDESSDAGFRDTFSIEIAPEFEMDEAERKRLVALIRNNFGSDVSQISQRERRSFLTDAIIFAGGILMLILYTLVSSIPVFSDFIMVVGWVLIWEGAHNLLFDNYLTKLDRYKQKQLAQCKINFK